jgi:hypothetical protein
MASISGMHWMTAADSCLHTAIKGPGARGPEGQRARGPEGQRARGQGLQSQGCRPPGYRRSAVAAIKVACCLGGGALIGCLTSSKGEGRVQQTKEPHM